MTHVRLNVSAEGHAEEAFVNQVLRDHLLPFGVYAEARRLRTSRGHRGGYVGYGKARFDIDRWLREDPTAWHTTLIDLYGLDDDFPGFGQMTHLFPHDRVRHLETAFGADIGHPRFIPHLQLHEYETLLFADPEAMQRGLGLVYEFPAGAFAQIASAYETPELINDGHQTAPSKRILRLIPTYDKINDGLLLIQEIGLERIRDACPHFNQWLTRLETLQAY